jgi:glycine dehydrogenase subunit 1
MPYLFNTPEERRSMLEAIGAASIDELFDCIPAHLRLQQPLQIPPPLTEMELSQHMASLADTNAHSGDKVCFLGGGAYDHFVPAIVDAMASRGEFYTSYTPYQPEVSQGNLQAMFEYQTLICQLTGMDVSNASLYDGGSAAVEAVLMSMAVTRRETKVVVAAGVHPEYREILQTYLANLNTELVTVGSEDGTASLGQLDDAVDETTACVLIQHPNFFGSLEDVDAAAQIAHNAGALLVQAFDPISLGLLKRPGDLGADIAIAEGQCLGTPMLYGGPYLGIVACREKYVRRLPGRIAGQTTDRRGRRCWVLTLQTREQHIRREKATSNICTNQGLIALRAAIYLANAGPRGLRDTAELCLQKAHYASEQITRGDRFQRAFDKPVFKEFVIRDCDHSVPELLAQASEAGYLAGVPLARWYPELDDCFLVAVTEKRTRSEIDGLAGWLTRDATMSASSPAHASTRR